MAHGLSAEEIDWIREGYRLFRAGDPAFMDRFAPDARLSFPSTLPAGGTYESPFDALEYFNTIGALFEDPHADPEEFLRVEDRVVVFGTFRGRARESGEEIAERFVHAVRLSGGGGPVADLRYVSFELFIDTAAVLRAVGRSPSG